MTRKASEVEGQATIYFSPDFDATTKDDLNSDRIAREAEEAASTTLPPQRGQLKKMALTKKPAGRAPTMQCDLGFLKLTIARDKSYIVRWCAETRKYPLIVICAWANHAEVMHRLWAEAKAPGMTKPKLVEKKNKMKRTLGIAKKPSMNTGTKATTKTEDFDEAGLAAMSSQFRPGRVEDNDEDDTGYVDENMLPPWWNECSD